MTTDTLTDAFWTRLDDVTAGMFAVMGARPVPMAHYADKSAQALWFIAAAGTDLETSLRRGPEWARHLVADGEGRLYATIDGTAHIEDDADQLDRIWTAAAAAWFDGGRQDDDIRLIRFDITEAEVWTTPGSAGFLYEIGKARLTGQTPEMGRHGTLRFAA